MAIKISSPLIRRTLSASGTGPDTRHSRRDEHSRFGGYYPACAWTSLTLVNGGQSENATFGTGDPRYCRQASHGLRATYHGYCALITDFRCVNGPKSGQKSSKIRDKSS
jgi:hypothetical protein